MLTFLPSFLRGVIAASLLALNTLFWCSLLFLVALVELVCRSSRFARRSTGS